MPADSKRFDAQRNALSALMARFAADRDSLIRSIHECQQQLSTIAAHLDQGQASSTPQLEELKRLIGPERRQAAAQVGNLSGHARITRFTAERDAQAAAIRKCEAQLAALTARFETISSHDLPQREPLRQQVDELQQEQQRVEAEGRAAAEQALTRATEAVGRINALADDAWRRIDDLAAARQADHDTINEMHLLRSQTDRLAASLSRLEARVEQMAGTAPRRPRRELVEPLLPSPEQSVPASAVPHRLVPAFAAVALILAAVGTVALVTPRDVPVWRKLVARWSVTPPAMSELSVAPSSDAFTRGLEALRRNDLAAAEAAFNQMIVAQPEAIEARNNLAVVLVEQQRYAAAAQQLRAALNVRSDYQRARTNLDTVEALLARQHPSQGSSDLQSPALSNQTHAADAAPAAAAEHNGTTGSTSDRR